VSLNDRLGEAWAGVDMGAAQPGLQRSVELAGQAVTDNPSAFVQRWIDPAEQEAWTARYPGVRSLVARLLHVLWDRARLAQDFREQLESDKLQAMKELAYGASHEINNPLANIASRAQLLLRGEQDPERRRSLATINSQAFRAHEMLADLMLFAKPPAIQRQPLDLAALVHQVARQLGDESPEGVDCQVSADERPFSAVGDAVQLAVALRSIGQNALEAMESGGSLSFRLSRVKGPPTAGGRSSWVEIEIRDTGPGLNDHERRHLFDPFFCGREAGRGLGLGLSKAWRIVQLHGGQIQVQSEPGGGARFVVCLPSEVVRSHRVSPTTTAAASAAGSGPPRDESTAAERSLRNDPPDA
jgi:signal transduction histidine kinase